MTLFYIFVSFINESSPVQSCRPSSHTCIRRWRDRKITKLPCIIWTSCLRCRNDNSKDIWSAMKDAVAGATEQARTSQSRDTETCICILRIRYVCIVYMVHHVRRVGYTRTHTHMSACSQAVGLIQPYKLHKAVCRRFVLKIRRYWRVFQSVDSESISASLSCLPTVT